MKANLTAFLAVVLFLASCKKEGSNSGGTAVFNLQATGNACSDFTLSGVYVKGAALDIANKITLKVKVSSPGSWNINTLTVAGISFSGSGVFTNTGAQTILLQGKGRPTQRGNQSFAVNAGASSCSFVVNVADTSQEYLRNGYWPLTTGSWWKSVGRLGQILDTTTRTIVGVAQLSDKIYTKHRADFSIGGDPLYSYLRKDGSGSYYFYGNTDVSSGWAVVGILRNMNVHFLQDGLDVLVLKDVLHTNENYYTDHPALQGGNPVTVRLGGTVINSNETVTINGRTFDRVYVIKLTIEIGKNSIFSAIPYDDNLYYFAEGVGLIKGAGYEAVKWQIK